MGKLNTGEKEKNLDYPTGKCFEQGLHERKIQVAYKCINWPSTSLDFWEMNIKTTVRYHYVLNRKGKIKENGKQQTLARCEATGTLTPYDCEYERTWEKSLGDIS